MITHFRNLLLCLMVLLVMGCSDTSTLITPDQINSILTCDKDIDIAIANGNYTGSFDINKACVDNVLLKTTGEEQTLVVTKGSIVQSTTVGNLVRNTENGEARYEGTLVLISAKVERNRDNALYLVTSDDKVSFRVDAPGDILEGTFQDTYVVGQTYDFVLYIKEQGSPDLTDEFTFNDGWRIKSFLVMSGMDILDVTMNQLVRNTQQGKKTYEGKVVQFTAEVEYALDNVTLLGGGSTRRTITLVTGDDGTNFYVRPPGDIFEGQSKRLHVKGQSYEFIVYIREQEKREDGHGDWLIWSYIIEE